MPRLPALFRACCVALAMTGATLTHAAVLDEAQAQWAAGKREQAIQTAEAGLKTTPDDPRLRFALGTMLLETQ